jgi:hypothetical protein
MTDSGVSQELKDAVEAWVAQGSAGDVNDHLDGLGIEHQPVTVHPEGTDAKPDVVGDCGDGYHGAWVPLPHGRWWSTCVPDPYPHA